MKKTIAILLILVICSFNVIAGLNDGGAGGDDNPDVTEPNPFDDCGNIKGTRYHKWKVCKVIGKVI